MLLEKPAAAAQMRKRPAGAEPEEVGTDADALVMRRPAGVSAGPGPVMRRPGRDTGAAAVLALLLRSCVSARMKELLLEDEGNRGEPRVAPPTFVGNKERVATLSFELVLGMSSLATPPCATSARNSTRTTLRMAWLRCGSKDVFERVHQ